MAEQQQQHQSGKSREENTRQALQRTRGELRTAQAEKLMADRRADVLQLQLQRVTERNQELLRQMDQLEIDAAVNAGHYQSIIDELESDNRSLVDTIEDLHLSIGLQGEVIGRYEAASGSILRRERPVLGLAAIISWLPGPLRIRANRFIGKKVTEALAERFPTVAAKVRRTVNRSHIQPGSFSGG